MTDLELYNKAKEAYYNGTPIMEDFEFDELEKKLGLENKSYVGTHKNPTYTVKHQFMMGSLSKVQIKEKDGYIDWPTYADEIGKYIFKYGAKKILATPKYDGCSFEVYVHGRNIETISSRGDGEYGKDLYNHLINKVTPNIESLNNQISTSYIVRGEVLIDKVLFSKIYSDFVNPRSFVSGLLNRDYCDDPEFLSMINNLSIVIYDVRTNEGNDDQPMWTDNDWDKYNYPDKPKYSVIFDNLTPERLGTLYEQFSRYRSEECPFALDGIVLKPTAEYRKNNLTDHRPKDCVAIKFAPMLEETTVTNIEWQLSNKTGEYIPVVIVDPVIMDGKQVTRASAHNFGYIIEKKISIGTKVILSLAGDIIPFIYKVTNTDAFDIIKIGIDTSNCDVNGVHLYKRLTKEEQTKMLFLASATSLGIPSIGPAAAEKIFEHVKSECAGDDFFDIPAKEVPDNILLIQAIDINRALGGKLGVNASKAFDEYLTKMSIKDIIVSCSFQMCGEKAAEQIVKFMVEPGLEDWTSLPAKAYEWCFDGSSQEMRKVQKIMSAVGKTLDQERRVQLAIKAANADQIPVILTGEPNDYNSKGDFLNKHPEYRMTGSWKEVQIVFTNSLDSNTGKMKKAREKGIEIRLY